MAEIGIAASIISIADTGFRLSLKLYTFGELVSTADKSVISISKDVSFTSSVVKELGRILDEDRQSKICSENALQTADGLVKECMAVFEEMEKVLVKKLPSLRTNNQWEKANRATVLLEKLKWPYLQPKLEYMRSNLERLKSTLNLIINVITLAIQRADKKESPYVIEGQRTLIEDLARSNDEYVRKFEQMTLSIDAGNPSEDDISTASPRPSDTGNPSIESNVFIKAIVHPNPTASMDSPTVADICPDQGVLQFLLEHYQALMGKLLQELHTPSYQIPDDSRCRIKEDLINTHTREIHWARQAHGSELLDPSCFLKHLKQAQQNRNISDFNWQSASRNLHSNQVLAQQRNWASVESSQWEQRQPPAKAPQRCRPVPQSVPYPTTDLNTLYGNHQALGAPQMIQLQQEGQQSPRQARRRQGCFQEIQKNLEASMDVLHYHKSTPSADTDLRGTSSQATDLEHSGKVTFPLGKERLCRDDGRVERARKEYLSRRRYRRLAGEHSQTAPDLVQFYGSAPSIDNSTNFKDPRKAPTPPIKSPQGKSHAMAESTEESGAKSAVDYGPQRLNQEVHQNIRAARDVVAFYDRLPSAGTAPTDLEERGLEEVLDEGGLEEGDPESAGFEEGILGVDPEAAGIEEVSDDRDLKKGGLEEGGLELLEQTGFEGDIEGDPEAAGVEEVSNDGDPEEGGLEEGGLVEDSRKAPTPPRKEQENGDDGRVEPTGDEFKNCAMEDPQELEQPMGISSDSSPDGAASDKSYPYHIPIPPPSAELRYDQTSVENRESRTHEAWARDNESVADFPLAVGDLLSEPQSTSQDGLQDPAPQLANEASVHGFSISNKKSKRRSPGSSPTHFNPLAPTFHPKHRSFSSEALGGRNVVDELLALWTVSPSTQDLT